MGWPYENTDPRGGLTYALRTRKSGIITLDVASRRLTVDVLSARQARDVPRILPGFVFVARYIPRCRRDVVAQVDRDEIRKGLSRDAAKNGDDRFHLRISREAKLSIVRGIYKNSRSAIEGTRKAEDYFARRLPS